jgi:hypothetical protein
LCNIGFIAKAYSSLLWPRGKDFFFLYLVSFFFSVPLNRLKFSYLLWTRSWGWMHDLYECSQLMWTFNWYHNNQINCMHVLCMFLLPLFHRHGVLLHPHTMEHYYVECLNSKEPSEFMYVINLLQLGCY